MELETAISQFEKRWKQKCTEVILLGDNGACRRVLMED